MKDKVLIVVGIPDFDYLNEKSAVSSFLSEIKLAFEKKGMEVCFPKSNKKIDVLNPDTSKKKSAKTTFKLVLKKWAWLYYSLVNRDYFNRQDRLINEFSKEDKYTHIVEFHTVGSLFGVELAEMFNAKLSVVFDSPVDEQYLEMYGTKTLYWNRIKRSEKITLERANGLMVYSDACETFVKKKYKIQNKINVLPCVLNKEVIENNPVTQFKIGFIGSFLSWHKVDLLVKAFNSFVKNTNPDSKLLLIGYGEEWGKVKKLVDELSLNDKVVLPGFVSEHELNVYKREMSLAIMPGTNWYGSPLKLFEYAQCGIPFIAPKSKTVKSIFDENKHCKYIDSDNELDSLINQITYLYNNPLERIEMGARVKQFYIENFSQDIYLGRLYQTLS